MFAVGVYVQSIPDQVGQLDTGAGTSLETIKVLGFSIDTSTATGMVVAYVVGAHLVAAACFAWHFMQRTLPAPITILRTVGRKRFLHEEPQHT